MKRRAFIASLVALPTGLKAAKLDFPAKLPRNEIVIEDGKYWDITFTPNAKPRKSFVTLGQNVTDEAGRVFTVYDTDGYTYAKARMWESKA